MTEDIPPLRVLKHCTTRWLSLERAVRHLLKLWPALHVYSDREISSTGSNDRVRRIAAALSGIEAKLCFFCGICTEATKSIQYSFSDHNKQDWLNAR